ncbi:uncharacterized protein PAE49_010293 isoform 2-T2 [Odontesthes bonariensis]|uniref:uncharacterized protein LOC142387983 isoform X2 n=1 Tax=Odontesthes bonariensis TaxID=219752 RepID=UPI003F58ACAC
MATAWREEDEDFKVGGVKEGFRSKPRFSYDEVKLLLDAVKKNRYILLKKFNQGVSADTKKQTWTRITSQVNSLGENHRQVHQIMKKWADLKCDGKRRITAMRGPNGNNLRKKKLGPVEKMVHKILMLSPTGGDESDLDLEEAEFSKCYRKGPTPTAPPYSYLSLTDSSHSLQGGASFDISPLSSPEKELEHAMDFDEHDDSIFPSALPPTSLDPLPDDALLRIKPVYTYSRNIQTQNHVQNPGPARAPPVASTSSSFPDAAPSQPPAASSSAANGSSSHPAALFTSILPPTLTAAPSSSKSHKPPSLVPPPGDPSTSAWDPSDPLPGGASLRRSREQVAQMASQSLQQQRASRMLLTSVSRSLEALAQSVQLLVESQQEFVQESLLLQRETVDVLRDFSNTTLSMLRDKSNSAHLVTHHQPPARY